MLPDAKECTANLCVNIFRHVDKIHCLWPVFAAFIVSKNAPNEVKLCERSWSGGPRLVAVACRLKCFGNDSICWQLIGVKRTKRFPGLPF